MTVYYSVEIQMSGMNKTDEIISQVASTLGATKENVYEQEDHSATIFFKSECKPTEMRERVKRCLQDSKTIHYIDVVYRWEMEMTPDRFVYWSDGMVQEYTGKIIFEEDRF